MCSSVLAFEALIVIFAIPVAIVVYDSPKPLTITAGCVLAVACIVAIGFLKRPWGVWFGWVLQLLIIATGLVVPMMLFLGIIFMGLWFLSVWLGQRADGIRAANMARAAAAETPQASSG